MTNEEKELSDFLEYLESYEAEKKLNEELRIIAQRKKKIWDELKEIEKSLSLW